MEKLILEKLEKSESGRERFVTTDLNVLKAVRELGNQGLVQWKVKIQPAQPLGLIVHDDQLNTLSDWTEKMICQIIGAEQTAWNEEGHDGVLKSTGEKIEIKAAKAYEQNNGIQITVSNLKTSAVYDYLVVIYWENLNTSKRTLLDAKFMVIEKEVVDRLKNRDKATDANKGYFQFKLKDKYNKNEKSIKFLPYICTLAELAELKHGYEHFLKMKGKVKPVEPPKETIQFVIDVWKPNRFNLMPYDKRYEDSSWYAEFAVAQLLGGTVTEQRQEGFDVKLKDGFRVQVKRAKRSINNRRKDGSINYVTKFNHITKDASFDLIVGLFWFEFEESDKNDLHTVRVLIMPKETAFLMKTKYWKDRDDIGFLKIWDDPKDFKYFFFTIDHLEELGQIGYEQFYVKYLKQPCEKVLGVENQIGSGDSNGNQIDLKPKFPIQFQISKRTNQADQRSA